MVRIPNFDEPPDVYPAKVLTGKPQGMTEEAQEIRRLWIRAVKEYHWARTGKSWDYRPARQWDVGIGKNPAPIWPKLLEFVKTHHVIPLQFFRAQFESAEEIVQPNIVMNSAALERYRNYVHQAAGNESLELKIEVNHCRLQYYRWSSPDRAESEILRDVLQDPYTSLSPLYVYCHATRVPALDDVAQAYESAALAQYLTNPDAYDEAWGDTLIPLRLRQFAAAYSASVAGKLAAHKRDQE
jgi:hypothetical protein